MFLGSYEILIYFIMLKFALEGLDHFILEPTGTERNLLVADHEIIFSRSMMEKCDSPRQDLILDRLSECEKVDPHVISYGGFLLCAWAFHSN